MNIEIKLDFHFITNRIVSVNFGNIWCSKYSLVCETLDCKSQWNIFKCQPKILKGQYFGQYCSSCKWTYVCFWICMYNLEKKLVDIERLFILFVCILLNIMNSHLGNFWIKLNIEYALKLELCKGDKYIVVASALYHPFLFFFCCCFHSVCYASVFTTIST